MRVAEAALLTARNGSARHRDPCTEGSLKRRILLLLTRFLEGGT
jgi:hypothetical protein